MPRHDRSTEMTARHWLPLVALGLIVIITAAWWALALWPLPSAVPAWLAEARFVCFGARMDTLPSAAGWLLLIGEPVALLGFLLVGWGPELRDGLRTLNAATAGRMALAASALVAVGGVAAGAHRVATAAAEGPPVRLAPPQRMMEAAPPLPLVTQQGVPFDLDRLRGRPVLVVFAYGHCETVCPVIVREALAARDALPPERRPRLAVVTLDPWRDVPSRLPALARAWQLDADDFALSADVPTVERALDLWQVGRSRNEQTGEIIHAPLTVVLDGAGWVVARTAGTAAQLGEVLAALR
jgi:cytochrome oxidase Cu insertion factor (SCO1/SenC/PrrC family)